LVKDIFYRQIHEALSRELDGNLFEDCACDLLRKPHPTLVCMPGGHDGGMDGAVADGEGEAYPLVCTTQERVIDNLVHSLERQLETGGKRRKVIVATSRALTPTRRRDLRDRAREFGFTLVQVYEQRAMATLLYRSSRWCKDLLDLSGKPAALSVIPPSCNRPLVELELLGREEDVEWLRSTSVDRVLVGDPGAGKTYLLYRLALEGWGLFLASDDEAEITNVIRDEKPEVIFVDDAHAKTGRLERLVGLRRRIGAEFSIVATTWKGSRDDVAAALSSSEDRVRTLEPLSRRQIQQIFEDLGVEATDEELLELVDQASNRPGLATTLAALWQEGDWPSVLRGDALRKKSLYSIRRLVGRDEEALLAILSLGGRRGMPWRQVGKKLGLDALETWERVASLSAAGVLSEVGGDCLAVQPRAMRPVLISSVFFSRQGPRFGDYREYLDLAPGYDCAVREIVGAVARGARIPTEEIQRLLERLDPAEYPLRKEAQAAWGTFVGLGHREALWAFEHYPGELVDIARPGLHSAPGATIRRLLDAAEAPQSQAASSTHPQLGVLRSWLREITDETLDRRYQAIRAARGYATVSRSEDAYALSFQLGCLALNPIIENDCIDPTRTGLISRRGPMPWAQLEQMRGVWTAALDLFEMTSVVSAPELFAVLGKWLGLARFRGKTSLDEERFIRQFVIRMLRDLVPLAAGRAGLTVALARFADELSIELPLNPDPRFEAFFPPPSQDLTNETEPLEALVEGWAGASPAEVVGTLLYLEQEAKSISTGCYSRISDLCRLLAAEAHDAGEWFEVLFAKKAPSSWLEPFLKRLALLPSFDDCARRCLGSELYSEVGIRAVLRSRESSPDLLQAALERAVDFPEVVRGMGFRQELSIPVTKAILVHADPALALEVAFGEWMAEPKGEVRTELRELWRQAVLRSTGLEPGNRAETHYLTELLSADSELAYEWLLRLDAKNKRPHWPIRSMVGSVLGFLGSERRQDLLERLSVSSVLIDHLPELVDRDVEPGW
jgi:hypothetical protein